MDAKLKDKAEELAQEFATQATTLDELNGLLRSLMKTALERMLNTELEVPLGRPGGTAATSTELGTTTPAATDEGAKTQPRNRKKGSSPKTIQGAAGQLPLDVPRDRNGTFEPPLIGPYQRRLAGFAEKILALDAQGLTTRDIQELVKELSGVEVSPQLVSEITADLDAEVKQWPTRRLDAVWPIVFLDGLVVPIRAESGPVREHTMYVAIGVNFAGKKALLGLWLAEPEGSKFWLSCLTDLKNRGLDDLFIVCVDGLSGFPEAIAAADPKARVQLCLVPLVRAALRYVTDADSREVIADLKQIYQAATVLEAEEQLHNYSAKWDDKYPTISKQWRAKWPHLVTMFDLPFAIRRATYTTNIIESINSVIRKFTRNRKQDPNRDSALKLIYMAIREASKKWTMPMTKWKEALNHFAIMFENRMPKELK